MLDRGRAARLGATLVALVASALFALTYGLHYGESNQTAYFLGALRLIDKSVLTHDWYAMGPGAYHSVFAYPGALLLLLDRGGWAVGAAMVVTATVGAMCIYRLLCEVFPPKIALPTFLLLVAWMTLDRTYSVGSSYIFDSYLQPSTWGSLFLLAALPPFVRGRWLASGIWLGLAGLMHANFLVLGIAAFGFAHMLLGFDGLPKRLLRQLGPSFLVIALLAPIIFKTAGNAGPLAQEVLFKIRSPHHFVPKSFEKDFFPFAAWQWMGFGLGAWALRGRDGAGARFGAVIVAMAVTVWSGTLLTTVTYVPAVAQVFVFRYAPFLELFAQILALATLVRVAVEPTMVKRLSGAAIASGLGGWALLMMLHGNRGSTARVWALGLMVALPIVFAACSAVGGRLRRARALASLAEKVERQWPRVVTVAALCMAGGIMGSYIAQHPLRLRLSTGLSAAERDLYAWIRASTPKEAVFLIPPRMERFRLQAERAIIADWKGSPILPSDIVEWYHRLEDISGTRKFRDRKQFFRGYDGMDAARVERLRKRYPITYAVVSPRIASRLSRYKTVYSSSQYRVLALDQASGAEAAPQPSSP